MSFSHSLIPHSAGASSRRIVSVLLTAGAAAWCWLYRDYFHLLFAGWRSEDFSYAWFVPPVVVWLSWTVRHRLRREQARGAWWGVLWLAMAGVLFVGGTFGGIKMLVFISMWASLVSFAGFIFGGPGLRALRMPIPLGLFAVPLPPFIANALSFRLRLVSSALAEWMLRLADIPVFRDGNIIDLGPIKLDVVDACSGLRYLLPALLIGWLQLRRNSLRLSELLLKRGDREGALAQLDELLQRNPGDARGHAGRGRLLMLLGRHEEALGELRIAVHDAPEDAGAAILLARAHLALGNSLSAVEMLRIALDRTPEVERLRLEQAGITNAQAIPTPPWAFCRPGRLTEA